MASKKGKNEIKKIRDGTNSWQSTQTPQTLLPEVHMRSNAIVYKVSTTGRKVVLVEKAVEKYLVYYNYFGRKY